jgi:hypothetical protein
MLTPEQIQELRDLIAELELFEQTEAIKYRIEVIKQFLPKQ